MEVVIITGMSGAGKTSVLNICQDNDYYGIDNIPPKLISEYFQLIDSENMEYNKFVFVIDIRSGHFLNDFENEIIKLRKQGHDVKIIYLDADDDELIRRYQEKRRPHPYKNLSLGNAIKKEREEMLKIRELSDYYLNTTGFNSSSLKNKLLEILEVKEKATIHIISFGFKYGILKEADLLFDVRFITNPFYIQTLKEKSGKEEEVRNFVLGFEASKEFINKIEDLVDFLVPNFLKQSKSNLVIGIGCTGGKHRSVVISEKLNDILREKYDVNVYHREQNKW
ncbi:RNase adapter RapZ [Helcococcus ovis]|uniref:RNase adapter RapZ n=1 Tax=Helcococcus ovis TaxID=72026 RepID=A0A4V3IYE2_9FIRM|nr:RNase adapter RapZ [Helcococcus ovis]TFF65147.1 RNase adapter RapZ [Helcococcus ovis]TFF66323.1 RNase adapter RapZ [Helcococcus ovis]TFF67739.1 RNase adapter RapZ [Helcococcus ovis]WNZ01404.1 RNase adapter RapZ [Helcococcus ovis]